MESMTINQIATLIYAKYDIVFYNDDNKKNASIAFCDVAEKLIPAIDWDAVRKEIKTMTYKRPFTGGRKKKETKEEEE